MIVFAFLSNRIVLLKARTPLLTMTPLAVVTIPVVIISMPEPDFTSPALAVLLLMTETLYTFRKRFKWLQVGRLRAWLSFHIFTGIVGPALHAEVACRLAAAFGTWAPPGPIVVGRDSRLSGPMMRHAVIAGLLLAVLGAGTLALAGWFT